MTLVISDTHLGKYDRKMDLFLRNLIKDYDRIILNGDFYDCWLVSFEEFISSEYSELFKILKSKETIYIYGNHDSESDINPELAKNSQSIKAVPLILKLVVMIFILNMVICS